MRSAIGAPRPFSPSTSAPRRAFVVVGSISTGLPAGRPSTVTVGKRWREYQGACNWDGMLDPLDETLRSEVLRYGEFAQAAYTCFDFDPSSSTYGCCRFPKRSLLRRSGFPDTGYRITRGLSASCSATVPRWAAAAPSWATRRTSWIGYVAVCEDEAEIERLGRRDIVVAYRGTATCLEWLENLQATLTPHPSASVPPPPSAVPGGEAMVERGFWSLFTSSGEFHRSLQGQVREEIERLLSIYGSGRGAPPISITVTGHSLGAALAVLTAYDAATSLGDAAPAITVMSFGGPRVGNESFRHALEASGVKVLRVVNTQDIVTKVPGFVIDNEGVSAGAGGNVEKRKLDAVERLLPSWLVTKSGWVYADIGKELRVSSQRSANVVACHDLKLYLDLVSEKCPLRSLAMQAAAAASASSSSGRRSSILL